MQEVYTYSMVSPEALAQQSGYPAAKHLEIANPLSDEWVFMRRSLMPSLNVLSENPGPTNL
jgi:phenylalanyl-tRNA synthetase beta subunit